jgi:hypothetical protein
VIAAIGSGAMGQCSMYSIGMRVGIWFALWAIDKLILYGAPWALKRKQDGRL